MSNYNEEWDYETPPFFELRTGCQREHWDLARQIAKECGVLIPTEPPDIFAPVFYSPERMKRSEMPLAACVGVIEHGPLLMFEWLVLNPRLRLSSRHGALAFLMEEGKAYASEAGKRPVMVVDRRRGGVGIRKMAERLGFASRNEHLEVLEG